jgi:exopolysaccharide production protein ExoZ
MRHFSNLQAMRGIAALMVVLVHSIAIPDSFTLGWAAPYLGKWGPAGVDFFFVISGFIITTVASQSSKKIPSKGNLNVAREFVIKRFIRIYPIYWLVLAIAILMPAVVHLAPSYLPERPLWRLFLLYEQTNNKIMAAWTLAFEMYFYLVVTASLFLFKGNIFRGLAFWSFVTLAIIVYLSLVGSSLSSNIPFSPVIIEFMFGILIAYAVEKNIIIAPLKFIFVGVIVFFIGAEINSQSGGWGGWYRAFCLGLPGAFLVYGLVAIEIRDGLILPKLLQRVGDISYSLYIWHQLFFATFYALAVKLALVDKLPAEILVLTWLVSVFVWSTFSFYYIERSSLAKLSQMFIPQLDGLNRNQNSKKYIAANAIFLGVIFLLPLFSYVATVVNFEKHAQIGAVVASWPKQQNRKVIEFYGDEILSKNSPIILPIQQSKNLTLSIKVNCAESLSMYVGYQSRGIQHDQWYFFNQGEQEILLDIPETLDSNRIWLTKNRLDIDLRVTKIDEYALIESKV